MTSQSITNHVNSGASATWSRAIWNGIVGSAPGYAGPVLRLTLAGVFFPHGAQKVLGWFGGYGFSGTYNYFTTQAHLPAAVAVFVILLEFVAPFLLIAGLGVRAVSLGLIGLMVGAIATVHFPNGFFMNWFGNQAGEGFEYHLLVIGIALALLVQGSGSWALDRVLTRR